MIDEILYMQIRILTQYAYKYNIEPKECNKIFEKAGIFNYIRDFYDGLHMMGDEYIVSDIREVLERFEENENDVAR